ncbi:hypothetical protein ACL02S_14500 [Nocardia sp. 004]|uniref:DUF7373 family lipoprotein n=1 Tax=Nocardia sp. 004 TaxID=3385978 RepID=UPI0039A11177
MLAFLLAASACGTDTDAPSDISVDIAELDAGNYPTIPVDPEQSRIAETSAVREAIRIGNATPLVMDVDNRFIFQRYKFVTRVITPATPPYLDAAAITDDEIGSIFPGLVAGWHTHGQRRAEAWTGREMRIQTIRFSDVQHAEAAAQLLSDRTPGESHSIDGYPNAHTRYLSEVPVGSHWLFPWLNSWLVHDDMLLYVFIEDPISLPFDPDPLADLAGRTFGKQIEMLKNYLPTPVAELDAQPLDVDGLLSRTLPTAKENLPVQGADPSGVYPKYAALHIANRPDLAKAAYDDAGVDYVTIAGAFIYRTRDDSSPFRLIAALQAQFIDTDSYDKIDGPAGLPSAECFAAKPNTPYQSDHPPICLIPADRYVIHVEGGNVQDARQRAAAQYKLLMSGR